jgi:hypothetical protein
VIYQVSSSKVRIKRWFESTEEAIAAFEHQCKHLGLTPPLHYPPAVSGDTVEDNGIAYPHRTCAAGVRDGHGYVFVERRDG